MVVFLLKGKVSALQCVFAFGAELVDLIEAVKERLLSVCEKSISVESQAEDHVRFVAVASLFFSIWIHTYPHLRLVVGEVLQSIRRKIRFRAAKCILDMCKKTQGLEALRFIYALPSLRGTRSPGR